MVKDKKNESDKILKAKKAKARRQKRQSEIDDGIQGLMAFLPVSTTPRFLSRNEVLRLAYEVAVKLLQKDEEAVKEEAATEEPVKKEDKSKKDDRDEPKGGAPMAC